MNPLTVAIVAVFASVALVSGSVAALVIGRGAPTRRRLRTLAQNGGGDADLAETSPLTDGTPGYLKRVGTFIPKSPREMTRVQRRLAAAGYHDSRSVVIYCIAELALPVIGFLGVLSLLGKSGLLFAVAAAVKGYLTPGFIVQRRVARRKKQVQNGLPDALDLFIVCLEAGLALDQAILKASEELEIAYPALAEELRLINIETRAGKPRLEALKNFAKRTQVDDVRSLVAMLVQTDKFGTSIGQALRTHAEESRVKRRQRAEEKAAKLGVKLVFPLVFCLLPAFFVVSLGPGIIKLMQFFATTPSLGGITQ